MLLRRYEYKLPGELNRSLTLKKVGPEFHMESQDNLITIIELYGPNPLPGKMTAQKLSVQYIPVPEVVGYSEALKWCPEGWIPDGDLQVIDGSKRLAIRRFEEVEPDTREVLEIVEAEYV